MRNITKKITVLLGISLSSILFISGCGKEEEASEALIKPVVEAVSTPSPEENNEEGDDSDTTDDTVAADLPPREGMVRSRLTNEWVEADIAGTRPVAIMVPNSSTASQYGLSKASILYECNVEGSMTRLMGVWGDWSDLEKVGNIRSCRDYYLYWAFEWDSIYIHFGGPFYINDLVGRKDTQNIDCINYSGGSFRATAKNSTDNAFTNTEYIQKAIDHYNYPTAYRAGYADENHYLYAPESAPNTLDQYPAAITAQNIDMSPAYPVTNCYFTYNLETGLYERFQHLSGESDGPHIDMMNNEQLTFKNILVQNTYFEQRDQKGYLAFQCHDVTRDGWFFTNGKGIHVTWKKTSDYGATRYYDDSGNEIQLNTGKTMVCILEDGDTFMVGGKKIL